MENIHRLIKHQLNSFEQNSITYTNTRADETESRFKKELELILEKINDVRMENSKYSIDLIKKTNEVEIDYKKLSEIKSEIIIALDHKILHMVNLHKETYSEFDIMRSEHEKIKMRFNELSDFLKNPNTNSKNQVGARNSTISINDMRRLSTKINFSNEKGKKVSSQNLISNNNNDSSMDENNLKDSMSLNLNKQNSRQTFNELNNNYNNNNLNANLEDINNPSSIYYIERRKILMQSETNVGNFSLVNSPEINEKNVQKNINTNINNNNPISISLKPENKITFKEPKSNLKLEPDLKNEKLKEKINKKLNKKETIDNDTNNNIQNINDKKKIDQKKNRNLKNNLLDEYNTLDKLYKSCDSSITINSEDKNDTKNLLKDNHNDNNNNIIDGTLHRAHTAKIKNLKNFNNDYFIKEYQIDLFEKNMKNDFIRTQSIIDKIENTRNKFPDLNNTIICLSEFNNNIKIFKNEFVKKTSNLDHRFIQLENFVKKKLEELAIKIKYYLPIKFNPYIYIKNFGSGNNNNQGSDFEEKDNNNNNNKFNTERNGKNPSNIKMNNYGSIVSNESNKNGNEKNPIKFININEKEEKRNM
jgi:hypothetical protein